MFGALAVVFFSGALEGKISAIAAMPAQEKQVVMAQAVDLGEPVGAERPGLRFRAREPGHVDRAERGQLVQQRAQPLVDQPADQRLPGVAFEVHVAVPQQRPRGAALCAQRAPRTSRPGRSPVGSPSSNVTDPFLMVAL